MVDQVTHWLFASEAAAIVIFRALALIATQGDAQARAGVEAGHGEAGGLAELPPFCEPVSWSPSGCGRRRRRSSAKPRRKVTIAEEKLPKRTDVVIYVPFFHRDDENQPQAHRFAPDLWLGAAPDGNWPLIPFSEGPARCPAHHLVPMMGSAMMAALLRQTGIALLQPDKLRADRPLPGTLDNSHMRFALRPVAGTAISGI